MNYKIEKKKIFFFLLLILQSFLSEKKKNPQQTDCQHHCAIYIKPGQRENCIKKLQVNRKVIGKGVWGGGGGVKGTKRT